MFPILKQHPNIHANAAAKKNSHEYELMHLYADQIGSL
jgi:hypothetical protein